MRDIEARYRPATLLAVGDNGLLVRFARELEEEATQRAIAFFRVAEQAGLPGVVEIVPNLVSVLLRYDPRAVSFDALAGEVRLLFAREAVPGSEAGAYRIGIRFSGPDLAEVAERLGLSRDEFIEKHNLDPMRVLGGAFAPGFIYCGLHPEDMRLPRKSDVRPTVPPGSVLFAAGQTAITSTTIPTGWHVIGETDFRNLDLSAMPPTRLRAGDVVQFEALS
ncbi:5-oxoprolinase subunit B family protein [Pelagibacterium montanilacus]|uniref:5-oxoprolinase subunit B family protein n=1 Tax=Pelagibacterium montanilacus TaxID=2185280 RepID=UPI0013E070B0|nr:carboxyltransferase domain-containing protein [Pelagibacterium montanilacus]